MEYRAKFNLKNGIKGDMTITAANDGDAFMTCCKMFAMADTIEWNVDKIKKEKRMITSDRINKALDLANEAEKLTELAYDMEKYSFDRLPDEKQAEDSMLKELVKQLDRALDGFAETRDYLTSALNAVAY